MISNDEMEDIIKIVKSLQDSGLSLIVKSLQDSGLLLKGVTKTVQNEVKEQKGVFISMLLGTLGASLLGNVLTGRGINRAGEGLGIVRASYGNKKGRKNNKMGF